MIKPHFRTGALVGLAAVMAACAVPPAGAPTGAASPGAAGSPALAASPAAKAAEAEGCEHMAEGPAKTVTATLAGTDAGVVAIDHSRYDVILAPQGDQFAGSVTLNSAKAGDLVVYLGFEGVASEALPLALFQDGKTIVFESSDTKVAHAACPAIKHKLVAPVGVGPVELRFGPTTKSKLSLVLEAGSHSDDHGDDHEHK